MSSERYHEPVGLLSERSQDHLYLRETITFRCLAPEAAVPLRYA